MPCIHRDLRSSNALPWSRKKTRLALRINWYSLNGTPEFTAAFTFGGNCQGTHKRRNDEYSGCLLNPLGTEDEVSICRTSGSFLRLLRRLPKWPSAGKNGPQVCQWGESLSAKGQVHGNKPGLGVFAKEEIYKFWLSGHSE